jgi:hypothetical protein
MKGAGGAIYVLIAISIIVGPPVLSVGVVLGNQRVMGQMIERITMAF